MTDDILLEHLVFLYGPETGRAAWIDLRRLMDRYRARVPPAVTTPRAGGLPLSQRDALLITYGDQVRRNGQSGEPMEAPLRTLAEFAERFLTGVVSGIHLLPFYPYSSDDGFSVIDYSAVDPALGDWDDIQRVGRRFRLMFDAVINHISAHSAWFQGFLRDDPTYRDYFIAIDGQPDLSAVVRPRALPLLTRFNTAAGEKMVWTTFSEDQIDLNYRNPRVLLEVVETLLFYVTQGAEFIRLDAIAYLWKEIGTPCIHLAPTHRLIQLLRSILDELAPSVMLITETNVPHIDNISYFGNGRNEAQLVYNFALPPLTLHAFHTGSAAALTRWAAGLQLPSRQVTFFNFLASHDGIGLNPARGLLPESEIEALVQRVQAHGGLVSYKHNPDGSQSPYELNINYFDALSDPEGAEALATQVDRFMAAQAIMLALVGLPGIYFHSLFGSRGWPLGVQQTGRSRTINRQKLELAELTAELAEAGHRRRQVYERYVQLLQARASSPALDPLGDQRVLELNPGVFAVARRGPTGGPWVLCLHNVSGRRETIVVDKRELDWPAVDGTYDLVDGSSLPVQNGAQLQVGLQPYQVRWLSPVAAQ